MRIKTSRQCSKCGETIEVIVKNFLQDTIADFALDLKTHFHYKKHNINYLSSKGLAKRFLWLFLALIIGCIIFPIWLITYPFWWIHEQLF